MTSEAFDDFIDDCFVEKDPICDLRRQASLELDRYASALIADMMLNKIKYNTVEDTTWVEEELKVDFDKISR